VTAAKRTFRPWRLINGVFASIGLWLASIICAPQLLAFPHHADIGTTRVYAETPLDVAAMRMVLARADALLATSPIYREPVGTRVFLTDGRWRWRVLALTAGGSVGFTRPWSDLVSDAVILNRSDVASDTTNSIRSLSGTIAHERTHIMVRRHLGLMAGVALPDWISEGYADHVAGEPDVNDPAVARLRATQPDHPVFFYIAARRRVEAALAANGGSVETLLSMPE
jgi:hypothetical protein